MRSRREGPSGVLVLDKPEGPTSHDLVARVRRLLRTRQVGHTGTLDPMATGVLALCIGRATRLARFLTSREKVYCGTLRLGYGTDTQDRTGEPLGPPQAVGASDEQIRRAMAGLTGRRRQTPPCFSAKRINGVRAHRLARAGEPVRPEPVMVEVHEFRAVEIAGDQVSFEVRCSPGTYIRSLAAELGEVLSCGGHLTALRRTASGEFGLEEALAPDEMEELARRRALAGRLIPTGRLQMGLPSVTASGESLLRVAHGRHLEVPDLEGSIPAPQTLCRVLAPGGALVAVGEVEQLGAGARIQPRVVLLSPGEAAAGIPAPGG
jgi:tRNA pseudouridine55 synthase